MQHASTSPRRATRGRGRDVQPQERIVSLDIGQMTTVWIGVRMCRALCDLEAHVLDSYNQRTTSGPRADPNTESITSSAVLEGLSATCSRTMCVSRFPLGFPRLAHMVSGERGHVAFGPQTSLVLPHPALLYDSRPPYTRARSTAVNERSNPGAHPTGKSCPHVQESGGAAP
ncbi:uncharacterized protein TRAVEDRAFT_60652 [Trametes versicolor FP-101664 SS1]|uniref:uncharacterized protein n=1 Tax=Trametes versicolor (strain FP-101664) TaxID=717944 RepID=UPI00046248F7|nr:uncharacterized protein TRAVEDRAFT_60652 [Trametes versicolor FP-101664 SS1]EIW54384.1 hypothetical protein TRAVEDRAFT_60652 [Trametes versicolor FP-101664 SS1]